MKPTIEEFEVRDFPINFQIFIDGQCFYYPTDGEWGEYTEEEYYDICWERLIYLIGGVFDTAPDKMQEVVGEIMFYLISKDFFKVRE